MKKTWIWTPLVLILAATISAGHWRAAVRYRTEPVSPTADMNSDGVMANR